MENTNITLSPVNHPSPMNLDDLSSTHVNQSSGLLPNSFSQFVLLNFVKKSDNRRECQFCKKVIHAANLERFVSHVQNACEVVPSNVKMLAKSLRDDNKVRVMKKRRLNHVPNQQIHFNHSEQMQTEVVSTNIHEKIADFIFTTGLPFHIVESVKFKNCFLDENNSYIGPSEKALSTKLLDYKAKEVLKDVDRFIADNNDISLVTDGWSNSKMQHFINVVLIKPRQCSYLYCSFTTDSNSITGKLNLFDKCVCIL